ncbi:hypothetical protein G9A89_004158 [Geosiphon pyriformis]|nr:hypothetical protein G9A89_004158 [Geosiphon pyriformis]
MAKKALIISVLFYSALLAFIATVSAHKKRRTGNLYSDGSGNGGNLNGGKNNDKFNAYLSNGVGDGITHLKRDPVYILGYDKRDIEQRGSGNGNNNGNGNLGNDNGNSNGNFNHGNLNGNNNGNFNLGWSNGNSNGNKNLKRNPLGPWSPWGFDRRLY